MGMYKLFNTNDVIAASDADVLQEARERGLEVSGDIGRIRNILLEDTAARRFAHDCDGAGSETAEAYAHYYLRTHPNGGPHHSQVYWEWSRENRDVSDESC